jgi:hypothetical protein
MFQDLPPKEMTKRRHMTIRAGTLVPILVTLLLATIGARLTNGQITNPIEAHIDHRFIIGNTTLPPGDYTFRMLQDSDLSAMSATSKNDKVNVDFLVRESMLDHTPRHSELVFRKYGNYEFLSKVFESGSKSGVELTETSRHKSRLVKQGQPGMEHTEEQK